MDYLDTPYGRLGPFAHVQRSAAGEIDLVVPCGPFTVQTSVGALVPQHTSDDMRRPKVEPLTFHPGGMARTVALETRTRIPTPLGPMEAELVTFHPDGSLHRLFPLNGKLSGYWTVEEEATLAPPMSLVTPAGPVTARLVSMRFSPAGRLVGLTLWPGETVEIATPLGRRKARIAMTFHEDGSLASYEPASPQETPTPIGPLMAFDPDAEGVHGDTNSLTFDSSGQVTGLATTMHTITVTAPGDAPRTFAPPLAPNLCDEDILEPKPLVLHFTDGAVTVDGCGPFTLADHVVSVERSRQGGFDLAGAPRLRCS